MPCALRVWPSVAADHVRFAVSAADRDMAIAVFDISGMKVSSGPVRVDMKEGAVQGELDLAGLPAGVYIVRVNGEGTTITAKVVKTKEE